MIVAIAALIAMSQDQDIKFTEPQISKAFSYLKGEGFLRRDILESDIAFLRNPPRRWLEVLEKANVPKQRWPEATLSQWINLRTGLDSIPQGRTLSELYESNPSGVLMDSPFDVVGSIFVTAKKGAQRTRIDDRDYGPTDVVFVGEAGSSHKITVTRGISTKSKTVEIVAKKEITVEFTFQ